MSKSEVEHDLDYVRALAEEGRSAPLVGGRYLVVWGVVYAIVLVAHWLIVTERVGLSTAWLWALWLGAGVLGAPINALLWRGVRNKPGISAASNRVQSAAWLGTIAALWVAAVGIATAVLALGAPVDLFNVMPASALLLYGVAHWTTSVLAHGAGRLAAVMAWLSAAVCFALVMRPETYLAAAAGVTLSSVLPGLIQLRQEPSTLV